MTTDLHIHIIARYRQGQHTPMTSRSQGQGQKPFIVTGVWPLNSFDGSVGHLGPRNSNAVRFTILKCNERVNAPLMKSNLTHKIKLFTCTIM